MSGVVLTNQKTSAGRPVVSGGEFVRVASAGIAWTIKAELTAPLIPALRRAADNPTLEKSVETVKTGPHRTVYRLTLVAGEFYLKHFRVANWKTLLLNALRPTKADLEWNAALRIARLGLPTFEPVALGRIHRGGLVADTFLVSRGIPQAIPLDEFATLTFQPAACRSGQVNSHDISDASVNTPGLSACRQSELRQQLARSLGELTGQLHRAAVEHADYHAANVLVRIKADGSPALWLIDLHRVYFRDVLSRDQRFCNLAFLHQFFTGKSTRADRLRFYRAYQTRINDRSSECADIAELETYLALGAHRGWKRADRAWRRGNRHVRKLSSAGECCRGIAALDVSWLKTLRSDPERLFRDNVLAWHQQTAKHRVAQIKFSDELAAPGGIAFFKCIEQRGLVQDWLARFRDSPVRKAWEFGHALLRRQVDTPRPILFVERRELNSRKCYLLTEAVPDTVNLSEFVQRFWPEMSQLARQTWLEARSRRLAWQMRCLHDSGFEHRDLKFPNLLVSTRTDDARVWLLDLDGMRAWRRLPEARAAQNLARINVSAQAHGIATRSDRLRFLKWYLAGQSSDCHSSSDWKTWWRRVVQISDRKLENNKRRGRIVR